MARTCSIADCDGVAAGRGWCSKHYQRWIKYGRADFEIPSTPVERFWRFVQKSDGCWTWTGAIAGRYGQCRKAPKVKTPAHRFSWELHFGPIPDGMFVCHHCDNPVCVRPDHLFLGDASANMLDASAKGRHPKQRASYRAKLNEPAVRHIRASEESNTALARRFNVSASLILQVKKRLCWRNIA